MTDKSAYGAVIGFGGMGLCLLVVLLGQLFGQFRIYAPIAMQWVNAHGDLLRALVWGIA